MEQKLVMANMPFDDMEGLVTVYYEDEIPAEIYIEKNGIRELLGNIYVGHVTKILQNTGAFIRFGSKNEGFLPKSKFKYAIYKKPIENRELNAEDEILVMVEAEAVKTKNPVLTTELKVAGKYFVISSSFKGCVFSHKLDSTEKERITQILSATNPKYGLIVRTIAGEAKADELIDEANRLIEMLDKIIRYGRSRNQGACLYEADDKKTERLKSLRAESTRTVVTDNEYVYESLIGSNADDAIKEKIRLYDDEQLRLFRLYNFSSILEGALDKKVMLKSGAYLIIEQTEAFVCIDVNSGKKINKSRDENYVYQVNLEAAREAARQIRLRQLSGTILIDFINMKQETSRRQLIEEFKSYVKRDNISTEVIDITRLGIMEVTRKKRGRSLREQIKCVREFED